MNIPVSIPSTFLQDSILRYLHSINTDESRISLYAYLGRVLASNNEDWVRIRRLARYGLDSPDEDFLNEVFLRTIKAKDEVQAESYFRVVITNESAARSYVKTTARNLAIDIATNLLDRSSAIPNEVLGMGNVFASAESIEEQGARRQQKYRDKAKLRLLLRKDGTTEQNICTVLKVNSIHDVNAEDLTALANLVHPDHELQEFLLQALADKKRRSYASIS
jgi:hypothetical protein